MFPEIITVECVLKASNHSYLSTYMEVVNLRATYMEVVYLRAIFYMLIRQTTMTSTYIRNKYYFVLLNVSMVICLYIVDRFV